MEPTTSCTRLTFDHGCVSVLYLKSDWYSDHFSLVATDGFRAWTCNASREVLTDRASQWDIPLTEYIADCKYYLSEQRAESNYALIPVGEAGIKLSWTLVKDGTKLEARWSFEKAADSQVCNCQVMNFLMEENIRIKEQMNQKTHKYEEMKAEADKCLAQSKRLVQEKKQFEDELFQKFVAVLNAKKAKIRELQKAVPMRTMLKANEDEDEDLGEDTDKEDDKENSEDNEETCITREDRLQIPEEISPSKPLSNEPSVLHDPDATQPFENEEDVGKDHNVPIGSIKTDTPKDDVDIAAAMLCAPSYTSAPKKRRF